MISKILFSVLVFPLNLFASTIQAPTVVQKALKHEIKGLKKSQPSFCESYEDYEECRDDGTAGPDGPLDDGEGTDPREGDEPGPDDVDGF